MICPAAAVAPREIAVTMASWSIWLDRMGLVATPMAVRWATSRQRSNARSAAAMSRAARPRMNPKNAVIRRTLLRALNWLIELMSMPGSPTRVGDTAARYSWNATICASELAI